MGFARIRSIRSAFVQVSQEFLHKLCLNASDSTLIDKEICFAVSYKNPKHTSIGDFVEIAEVWLQLVAYLGLVNTDCFRAELIN